MYNSGFIMVDVLIAVASVIMLISAVNTYLLIKKIKKSPFIKHWKVLFSLMVLIFFGYLTTFLFINEENGISFTYLVGFIYFCGSLFVLFVVQAGSLTIVELLNTTVSKVYVENVIHLMADTLIVIDTNDNASIRTVNNAALNLLRYQENDLTGQSVKKILSADLFGKAHILQLNDLDEVKNIETFYLTSEGEEIPVRFSASVLKDSSGKVEGVIYVAQDIRESKKAEDQIKKYVAQLRESEEKLKELNASKDKFFSIIAHDLRNPFGSVLGYSEIIAKECLDLDKAELKEFSETLHSQAKIIYDLLENLLTWSRIQTGRLVFSPEYLNIEEKMMTPYDIKTEEILFLLGNFFGHFINMNFFAAL